MAIAPRTPGMRLFTGGLDATRVRGFFEHPAAFSAVCTFIHEKTGEKTTGVPPSEWQLQVMTAWEQRRFVVNNKPRQARSSEAFMRVVLKHAEYRVGLRAVLCVNKDSVADNLFMRINDHYENQPDDVRVPLRSGEKRGSKNRIDFIHGGGIDVVSAQEKAPSVGASPRIFWFSEFGKITPSERQKETVKNLIPGGQKKPDLMIGYESTPGKYGDGYHSRWLKSAMGTSRYYPIFMPWVHSDEYTQEVEEGWEPNEVERELMEVYGATLEHARFIHTVWHDEFEEDWDAVWNMYPRDEFDGWERAGGSRGFSAGTFSLDGCIETRGLPTIGGIKGFGEIRKPASDEEVLMVVDPAGWSTKGDPNGIMVFGERGCDQLSEFLGLIDPLKAADVIWDVCAYYMNLTGHRVTLAIESNKSDLITALRDRTRREKAPFEFYNDKAHGRGASEIGWQSTAHKKQRGETRLAENVKRRMMFVKTRAAIAQLMSYDPEKAWKRESSGGSNKEKHHYELAICAIIAADVMVTLGWLNEAPTVAKAAPTPVVLDPYSSFINGLIQKAQRDKLKKRQAAKRIF